MLQYSKQPIRAEGVLLRMHLDSTLRGGIRMNTRKHENDTYYRIVAGPNKDLLFDACKYAYSRHGKIEVNFDVASEYLANGAYRMLRVTDFWITGIEHEDGSGESFNLHGYCKAIPIHPDGSSCRFEAYYNSRTRDGHITFHAE